MFVKPRPYQQDIINKTLETTKSTLIQLPTGGGKTIISKEIAIGLINKFNKKILFIAPKIVLMEQTLETFKALKPQKVHGSNNKFDKEHHILISTLQTASRRNSLSPDVIIIDEVHFGYEKKMLNKIMEYNPNARIIGLSATPFDENGYPFKGFDVIINDYDLVYMIKNKYLVPLRSFILVKPDLSNVDIIAGDYEINQLSEAVSKNAVIMEIVATSKPYIEKSIKTIVFAVDINHAELLKTAFQNEGFTTEALHSKSEEDDNEVIERFKRGYIKVLVSVLKLTTGFDVPETDLAIIARPTKSQNLYKQMVGRVLRTVDFEKTGINKKFAILLDCGNVIENLGKPLEPIIPKDELEKKIQKLKCKNCESENVKLKKSSSNLFWECQDCGYKKELENKNHYKCKNCDKKYSYQDGDFELVNNKLYLNCECGYETEISIATGDEEFREVDSGITIKNNNEIENKIYQKLTFDNVVKVLSNEYVKQRENSNKYWKEFKLNQEKNKSLEELSYKKEQKEALSLYYEEIYDCLVNDNIDFTIDNIFNEVNLKYGIKSNQLMNYFKEYLILEKQVYDNHYNAKVLSKIEVNKNFDLLLLLIDTKYFYKIEEVFNICYSEKLASIKRFLIEKFNIKKFDYYISFYSPFAIDFSLKDYFDLEFFDDILDLIEEIELSKFIDLEKIWEPDNDEEITILFQELIDGLIFINNHFKQKNIKILVYEREILFEFVDFFISKEYVHSLNLKKLEDWINFISSGKKPLVIPCEPNKIYSEWISWEDWLNSSNTVDNNTFYYIEKNFDKLKFIQLEKKTIETYFKYINNKHIPKVKKITTNYLSFEKAREYTHSLNLKSKQEWKNFVMSPDFPPDIPSNPHNIYQTTGWINYGDWLGQKEQKQNKLNEKDKNIYDTLNASREIFIRRINFCIEKYHDEKFYLKNIEATFLNAYEKILKKTERIDNETFNSREIDEIKSLIESLERNYESKLKLYK